MPYEVPRRHHSPPPDLDGEGDNYYISLSDLMVGMLFIFLILLTFFALQSRIYESENEWLKKLQMNTDEERLTLLQAAVQTQTLEERLQRLEQKLTNTDRLRAELLQRIRQELETRGVQVETIQDRGVLRLPQDMLFDPGSATLRPRGDEALRQLADVLRFTIALPQFQERLESIYIEGHTDNIPIRTANFRDNLSLSAARAMNTYQALIRYVPELESISNNQKQALFGISGYGELRAIGDNDSVTGRELNRRIDFRFVLAAPRTETESAR
jgi:chemotaxis protein MotB